MDISNINTQYLNPAYVPFSSSAVPAAGSHNPGESGAFAEILKRAQRTDSSSSDNGIPSSPVLKKTVIDKNDKLYELCMELETFLIKNLVKSMRSTVQKSDLVKTGFAGEIYEDMLYDEYAKTFAKNANFGFAEMAYKELSAYQ